MESIHQEGDTVRITATLLSSYANQYGRVVYVGSDRIEVELGDAVIPFLPCEVAPADLRWVYAD
jgi:hypothetical protein